MERFAKERTFSEKRDSSETAGPANTPPPASNPHGCPATLFVPSRPVGAEACRRPHLPKLCKPWRVNR
eukprot:414645-Pyramimonas_sp.AAC.1